MLPFLEWTSEGCHFVVLLSSFGLPSVAITLTHDSEWYNLWCCRCCHSLGEWAHYGLRSGADNVTVRQWPLYVRRLPDEICGTGGAAAAVRMALCHARDHLHFRLLAHHCGDSQPVENQAESLQLHCIWGRTRPTNGLGSGFGPNGFTYEINSNIWRFFLKYRRRMADVLH